MNEALYWIWVQKAFGFHANINSLIRYFGGAKQLYDAGEEALRLCGIFTDEISQSKLASIKNVTLEECEKIITECKNENIDIVTAEDEAYPKELLKLEDYPAVLYVKGDLSCVNKSFAIAVIGTRNPTSNAVETAKRLTSGISKKNAVIVSGGALGIDSVAHKTAIETNGKTVLVLGGGHLSGYLKENEDLRNQVSENGAVISEYPPFVKSHIYAFPKRNRIISGISKGVVIVQAGAKSGTLNTAKHAKNQGRDVFVIPGDVSSGLYSGSNALITEGAKAIFSSEDVLNYYIDYFSFSNEELNGFLPFEKNNKVEKSDIKVIFEENIEQSDKKIKKISPESVSKNAFLVYNLMSGRDMSLDDIVRESKLPVNFVLASLTELEMESAVSLREGGIYTQNYE